MKKFLLLLTLILGITLSYSQNDCSQGDGTYKYQAELYIGNVPIDFDKDDFINHIIGLDNISNEDLTTLNTHITSVYKIFPSSESMFVTIDATTEIYSILTDLDNSIEFHYCVNNDCSHSDGTSHYYALLIIEELPNEFDKDDFINHIIELDNISNEDLSILNEHITSVSKAFPTSQTEWLQRVVNIDTTIEIYSILADLNNSIEFHECQGEVILGMNDIKKNENAIVYPNPITENSVIKFDMDFSDIKIEILNSLGQIIYQNRYSGNDTIELKNISLVNGIYFIKIYNLTSGTNETLKIVKK